MEKLRHKTWVCTGFSKGTCDYTQDRVPQEMCEHAGEHRKRDNCDGEVFYCHHNSGLRRRVICREVSCYKRDGRIPTSEEDQV